MHCYVNLFCQMLLLARCTRTVHRVGLLVGCRGLMVFIFCACHASWNKQTASPESCIADKRPHRPRISGTSCERPAPSTLRRSELRCTPEGPLLLWGNGRPHGRPSDLATELGAKTSPELPSAPCQATRRLGHLTDPRAPLASQNAPGGSRARPAGLGVVHNRWLGFSLG